MRSIGFAFGVLLLFALGSVALGQPASGAPDVSDASASDAALDAAIDQDASPEDAAPPEDATPTQADAADAGEDAGPRGPSDVGFSLGLHGGYTVPFGRFGAVSIRDVVSGAVPVGIDVGYIFE